MQKDLSWTLPAISGFCTPCTLCPLLPVEISVVRRHKYNQLRRCRMVLMNEELCSVFKDRLSNMTFNFGGILVSFSVWAVDHGNNVLLLQSFLKIFFSGIVS